MPLSLVSSSGSGLSHSPHYRPGEPYSKKDLAGAKRLRRTERNVKSPNFKRFIRSQGKSFRYNEWKKVMETWQLGNGRIVENHYWRNKKTGETWHHG